MLAPDINKEYLVELVIDESNVEKVRFEMPVGCRTEVSGDRRLCLEVGV